MTEMELKQKFEYKWKQQHPIWVIMHIGLWCASCLFAILAVVSFFKGEPTTGLVFVVFFLILEVAACAMSGSKGAHWMKYKNEHTDNPTT